MERSYPTSSRFRSLWDRNPRRVQRTQSESRILSAAVRRRHSADFESVDDICAGNLRLNRNEEIAGGVERRILEAKKERSIAPVDCSAPTDVDLKTRAELDRDFKKAVVYLQALTRSYSERLST